MVLGEGGEEAGTGNERERERERETGEEENKFADYCYSTLADNLVG